MSIENENQSLCRLNQLLEEANKLKKEGQAVEAIKKFTLALDLDPNCFPALTSLSALYEDQEMLDLSIKYHQQFLELQPENYKALSKLARVIKKKGELSESIETYKKSLTIDPEQPAWVYNDLGDALRKNSNIEEAISIYEIAKKMYEKHFAFYIKLSQLYSECGHVDGAIQLYKQAVKDFPKNSKLHTKLVKIYDGTIKYYQAVLYYRSILQIKPKNFEIQKRLVINSRKLAYKFSYPFSVQKSLFQDSDRPLVIFDVGSHEGNVAKLYQDNFPNSQIYCFEPTPDTFQKLTKKLKTLDNFKLNKVAISDCIGTKIFNLYKKGNWNSVLAKNSNIGPEKFESVKVQTTTLDKFCKEQSIEWIDILKFDIQGGELQALHGAMDLLSKEAIGLVYTEVHFGNPYYEGQPMFHDIASFLYKKGFVTYDIFGVNYGHLGNLVWGDAIFLGPSLKYKL